ncbi:MAG: helix-turn-helix transcriptional regulator [Betaproteobacteria bacterium]|nr:helix-turn-helix transcriptional regulator [Betaproteobacteria bacterium]
MADTKKLVGARIKELRRQAGLTQEQLAERVGLDSRHLSRLEVGRHYPSLQSLERIARALDVRIVEFFQFPGEVTTATLRNDLIKFAKHANESQLRLAVKVVKLVVA